MIQLVIVISLILKSMKSTTQEQNLCIQKASFVQFKNANLASEYDLHPKELGRGAYGVVYKAKQKNNANGAYRAIKVISKKMIKSMTTLMNELQNLSVLDHPDVIKMYEAIEDPKSISIVTDLCEGGQLFDRLQKHGSFSENHARQIFLQMIEAVNYCHKQKICHRDLKPENFIFLNQEQLDLKLIDFGLSFKWKKSMRDELKQRNQNKLVGTSYYIAPEIIKGSYDQRCDIWSAGVILYILVTAMPPFDGENDREIINAVKKGEYTLNVPQMKSVTPECKDLIKKLLQPEDQRITIEQIFQHPWMKMKLPDKPLKCNFKRMSEFVKYSKLKKIAATFIAFRFSEKQVEQLSHLFKQIDKNHDGQISIQQMKQALQNQKQNTSLQELHRIMNAIDTDKNGLINYTEFLAASVDESYLFKKQNLLNVFKMMDKDGNGNVDREQLKQILQKNNMIKMNINGKEVDDIMEACDKNKDGTIDFAEFIAFIAR